MTHVAALLLFATGLRLAAVVVIWVTSVHCYIGVAVACTQYFGEMPPLN
jgi:hypothetical protein